MMRRRLQRSQRLQRLQQPQQPRLGCHYSVYGDCTSGYSIRLSLTFSSLSKRDLAKEKYLTALSQQAQALPRAWLYRFADDIGSACIT